MFQPLRWTFAVAVARLKLNWNFNDRGKHTVTVNSFRWMFNHNVHLVCDFSKHQSTEQFHPSHGALDLFGKCTYFSFQWVSSKTNSISSIGLSFFFQTARRWLSRWQFSTSGWHLQHTRTSHMPLTLECVLLTTAQDLCSHIFIWHTRLCVVEFCLKSKREMESIKITPGFCPNCGSILPHLRPNGKVKCYNCLTDWPPEGECGEKWSPTDSFIHSFVYSRC